MALEGSYRDFVQGLFLAKYVMLFSIVKVVRVLTPRWKRNAGNMKIELKKSIHQKDVEDSSVQ